MEPGIWVLFTGKYLSDISDEVKRSNRKSASKNVWHKCFTPIRVENACAVQHPPVCSRCFGCDFSRLNWPRCSFVADTDSLLGSCWYHILPNRD